MAKELIYDTNGRIVEGVLVRYYEEGKVMSETPYENGKVQKQNKFGNGTHIWRLLLYLSKVHSRY